MFYFFAQTSDLQDLLEKEMKGFKGDVGIYVLNLKTGEEFGINADTIFPTAIIFNISILVGIFNKIEKGELDYHQKLVYRDSIKY